jgi:hypothetical protein
MADDATVSVFSEAGQKGRVRDCGEPANRVNAVRKLAGKLATSDGRM